LARVTLKVKLNLQIVKIRKILVSQPEPQNPKSPYFELARKYNLKVDFKPFNQVEGYHGKRFSPASKKSIYLTLLQSSLRAKPGLITSSGYVMSCVQWCLIQ
jgi:hypothetical protein